MPIQKKTVRTRTARTITVEITRTQELLRWLNEAKPKATKMVTVKPATLRMTDIPMSAPIDKGTWDISEDWENAHPHAAENPNERYRVMCNISDRKYATRFKNRHNSKRQSADIGRSKAYRSARLLQSAMGVS